MRPGARFGPGDTRPAGHIFYIPPENRPTDEPKVRPHFLVNRCDPLVDPLATATLAHMSTKPTEHVAYGCPIHELPYSGSHRQHQELGSFVIGARLLPYEPDWLSRSAMSAVDEVRSVRHIVLQAVGLGEGAGAARGSSVRGRLVRVHEESTEFRYGFVLTGHSYSATRRYQVIVPIINRLESGPGGPEILEPTRWDVVPARQPWWNCLPFEHPMLDTAGLISLSEPWRQGRDPRRWLTAQIEVLNASIDAMTLAEVEAKIYERLGQ